MAVGFRRFHSDANFDFQLNRLVSDGTPEMLPEVSEAARRITTFADWTREMFALADRAEAAGRIADAARYVRAGEFFLRASDAAKKATYERFIALFARAEHGFERHAVPFDGAQISALRYRHPAPRGTVVVCGGFDSFIEEFHGLLLAVRERGFDVIAFDGPGQGAMLVCQGRRMMHEWEKPVAAVLDHFDVRDVTFVGISLGGYLALRAAAFERRIARVVAFDIMFDFFACVVSRKGRLMELAARALLALHVDPVLDSFLAHVRRRDQLVDWGIEQGMHVFGVTRPSAFLRTAARYCTAGISSRVTQDVLLLAGAEDHFVPLRQLAQQRAALTNARSVTERVFRADENAASHCQVGNYPLVIETIVGWIGSLGL